VFQLASPQIVQASNITNARVRGVELFGRLDLTSWLAVSGSWTRLDTEIRRSRSDLPGRPEDEYDVRLELAPFDGRVKLVGEVQYTDEIPANEIPTLILGDRTTYDASLAVDLAQLLPGRPDWGPGELLVSVSGQNLTDRSVRDALGFPQPGRMLTFGGEVRW